MTQNWHTPIEFAAPATSLLFNTRLSQLDSAFTNLVNGDQAFTQVNVGTTTNLQIVGDAIAITRSRHTITPEAGISDDLATINGFAQGDILYLKLQNSGDSITFKHNTGNIFLSIETDFVLDDHRKTVAFMYDQTTARWMDVGGVRESAIVTRDFIHLQDQKAQNTAGGDFTSGAWQTRVLNTEVSDTGGHCSLASNQFTLAAGTYELIASAPANLCARHQLRLQNATAATTILTGTSQFASTTDSDNTVAHLRGRFTANGTDAFEIQHRCQTTRATDGFGIAANLTTEVYTDVILWKVA